MRARDGSSQNELRSPRRSDRRWLDARAALGAGLLAAFVGAAAPACSGGDVGGTGGAGAGLSTGSGEPQKLEPASGGLRRVLAAQYVNSIRLIFGDAAAAVATPPTDAQ